GGARPVSRDLRRLRGLGPRDRVGPGRGDEGGGRLEQLSGREADGRAPRRPLARRSRRRRPARPLSELMPSRYLDEAELRRQAEYRFDFARKGLGGRVVLVAGGTGGLGAAITALLLHDGALPVVGYRANRGRALAPQQNPQALYRRPPPPPPG